MAFPSQDRHTKGSLAPVSPDNIFRSRRFQAFLDIVDEVLAEKGECRVLDIGGTIKYWQSYGIGVPEEVSITLVNLTYEPVGDNEAFTSFVGDARDLSALPDQSFDIVHSNSVIEHVGLWKDMAAMAREVRRLAPRYFIQTPNYWFPIEAHYRLPYFHLLPDPVKQSFLLRKRRGFVPKANDVGEASHRAQYAFLLTHRQMQFLFPDAEIKREKFFGFTKSLMAIKR